jgi:hypothetical protein
MSLIERPERMAVCQHPNGEGVWWGLNADEDGSRCVQDCDCKPEVYVRADTTQGAVVLDDTAIERAALALAREPGWDGTGHDANEAARRILVALGGQ